MVTTENITFENPQTSGRIHWQDIVYDNKVVGALIERESGLLVPLVVTYQKCVPETLTEKAKIDQCNGYSNTSDCEDKGMMFAQFNQLDNFIDYLNLT